MGNSDCPSPSLQISFYDRLQAIQALFLHNALSKAIEQLNINELDQSLAAFAQQKSLNILAREGVRGEVFYATPLALRTNPRLLGYYRTLYGFSQKEFYKPSYFGPFKCMEESGRIPEKIDDQITGLCQRCGRIADELILGIDDHSIGTVRDLQILTLGPQFRGSQNTKLGRDASLEVYELLRTFLGKYVRRSTKSSFSIVNDSKREVMIEFKSDPDIRIVERLPSSERLLVSIEIKGGADYSNIHNRLGEAEKSHQKARALGSNERWTIYRVRLSPEAARKASPSTTDFFNLEAIKKPESEQGIQFREKLASVLSIRTPGSRSRRT